MDHFAVLWLVYSNLESYPFKWKSRLVCFDSNAWPPGIWRCSNHQLSAGILLVSTPKVHELVVSNIFYFPFVFTIYQLDLFAGCYIYIYMYGWWFGTWLLFSPILGMMIQSDFHIFHGSWNHQLDKYMNVLTIYWYTVCTKNSKAMCHSFGQIVDQKVWWFCVQYQPHTHPVQLTKKRVATSSGQSWQWKIRWLKRNIIWINYEDLTETSLEWWLLGVSIPKY